MNLNLFFRMEKIKILTTRNSVDLFILTTRNSVDLFIAHAENTARLDYKSWMSPYIFFPLWALNHFRGFIDPERL